MDEKTSIQARQRLHPTKPAIPGAPVQVADRYKRMGALQLFCGVLVASGRTFARCYAQKCFADFQAFLRALFASALCQGLMVLHLILDNGPPTPPNSWSRGSRPWT